MLKDLQKERTTKIAPAEIIVDPLNDQKQEKYHTRKTPNLLMCAECSTDAKIPPKKSSVTCHLTTTLCSFSCSGGLVVRLQEVMSLHIQAAKGGTFSTRSLYSSKN